MLRNVFGHPSLTLHILQSVSSSVFGWQWGSGTRGTLRPTSTFSETLWCQSSWFTSPHLRKDLFWWDVWVLLFQSQGYPRCGGTNHLSHHCMCICLCWVWESVFSRVDWIWILYPLFQIIGAALAFRYRNLMDPAAAMAISQAPATTANLWPT